MPDTAPASGRAAAPRAEAGAASRPSPALAALEEAVIASGAHLPPGEAETLVALGRDHIATNARGEDRPPAR